MFDSLGHGDDPVHQVTFRVFAIVNQHLFADRCPAPGEPQQWKGQQSAGPVDFVRELATELLVPRLARFGLRCLLGRFGRSLLFQRLAWLL